MGNVTINAASGDCNAVCVDASLQFWWRHRDDRGTGHAEAPPRVVATRRSTDGNIGDAGSFNGRWRSPVDSGG